MLRQQKWAEDKIDGFLQQLTHHYKNAALPEPDRLMLEYVEKLTLRPGDVTSADVELLRHAGFDDRAIHDICVIAAYFNFVNRIADGLGVELEQRFIKTKKTGYNGLFHER